VAISSHGFVDFNSLLYFAIFWTIWSKEASYSTRFDTTDLSAQLCTLATCFAVLFASLSVPAPLTTLDGSRIMMLAAFVAGLHCLLHIRIVFNSSNEDSHLARHIQQYAVFNASMTFLECLTWSIGVWILPTDWPYRWCLVVLAILLALRVPRAFLANDFHGE
jgi:low temperature requirement protein LtrA